MRGSFGQYTIHGYTETLVAYFTDRSSRDFSEAACWMSLESMAGRVIDPNVRTSSHTTAASTWASCASSRRTWSQFIEECGQRKDLRGAAFAPRRLQLQDGGLGISRLPHIYDKEKNTK